MAEAAPVATVYVSNIAFKAVPKDLADGFATFGTIKRATILTEFFRGHRRSRGIGFVEFETADAAKAAVAQSRNVDVLGRKVSIQFARPKQPHVTALIVGIPAGTTKEMVLDAFKAFKPVDVKIVFENREIETRNSKIQKRGFGFVKFGTEEELENCLKDTKQVELNGGSTIVSFAKCGLIAKPRRRPHYRKIL